MRYNSIMKYIFILLIFLNISFTESKKKKENENNNNDNNNKQSIKVSIIIPTYNSAEFIGRNLDNTLNQTLKEIEVIIVDDKSTDDTLEVLKIYEDDTRLKIVTLSENRGPSLTRNIGMELALGEFIGFIDSDDYVDERYYENLYSFSKDKDIVVGRSVVSPEGSTKYVPSKKFGSKHGRVWDSIWRKSFIVKNNLKFDINLRNMEDCMFRRAFYAKKPRSFSCPDNGIYYYYKVRKGSLVNFTDEQLNSMNNEAIKINTLEIEENENNYKIFNIKKLKYRIKSLLSNIIPYSVIIYCTLVMLLIIFIIISFALYIKLKNKKLMNESETEKLLYN